jgi:hypothetical protein
MNLTNARVIADKYLAELKVTCPVDIEFNYSITEEHPVGHVFFYNSKEFWKTRDFSTSLAGNGPVLVKSDTGELVVLPSSRSVIRSLRELFGEESVAKK